MQTSMHLLKLFGHWSEPIVKIKAYHLYIQSVEIILSTFMMIWLIWLSFNDIYSKSMCIMYGYVLKLIHLLAQCVKITNTVLFLKRIFFVIIFPLFAAFECLKVNLVALRFT